MSTRDLVVTYTTWAGLNAKSKSQLVTEPWPTFVEKFGKRRKYLGQFSHPGWSGAVFGKPRRCDENVTTNTFLVLDHDHNYTIDQARELWGGGDYLGHLYTSKSHVEAEHAFRVSLPLSRPVNAKEYEVLWNIASTLCHCTLDPACKDVSRFWYQPGVLEDDSIFVAEAWEGAPLDVDYWLANLASMVEKMTAQVEETPPPKAKLKSHKPKPNEKKTPSSYSGRGILFAAFEGRGWLGKEIDGEKVEAICPWASSHTPGKGSSSSTVLYYAKPGHEMGALHCSHSHCVDRTIDDVLALFSQEELDTAREREGLPAFKKPATKVEGAAPPIDFDELEDPKGPDGVAVGAEEKVDRNWGGPTDLGNAERLVAMHGENIRYCYPKKKWLIWCGTHWAWDDSGTVSRMAKQMVRSLYQVALDELDKDRKARLFKWAFESEGNARIAAAITLAQSEPGVPVRPDQLDADPWAFNVANGTIDLRTGKIRAHDRKELCTRIADVKYDPKANSTLWEKFLTTATNGDASLITYMQRACGYAMQGTVCEKHFWVVFGNPDTSKSTFIAAIGNVFGGYHESADADTWLQQNSVGGNRGDMVKLMGSRLVTSSEFPANARWNESIIKKVTGADLLTYAAKYEAEVTFAPTFALWCACNDAPKIRDNDAGMWSRAQRLPFDHVVPKAQQDKRLAKKLARADVLSAILTWCVQGCIDWQRDGLSECAAVDASVLAYKAENDRCLGFVTDCLEFFDSYRCSTKDLRDGYEAWCRDSGIKHPLSGNELAKRLEDKGAEQGKSHGKRYWRGVRLAYQGDTGDAGASFHRNFSTRGGNETLLGNECPADPADTQGDILDPEPIGFDPESFN